MLPQTQIIILVLLLIVSAFSGMAEAALLSGSRFKTRHWVEKKKFGAVYVKKLKDDPGKLLSTLLMTNNLANTAAAAITTSIAISYFHNNAVGIATGIAAFLIVVFGDVVPKSIGANNSDLLSPIAAPVVWYLGIAIYPVTKLLDLLVRAITKLIGSKKAPFATKEELKSIIKYSEEEGSIQQSEKKLIQRIFEFGNITVSDIMTRKKNIVAVGSEMQIKEVLQMPTSKIYSRFPVYEKSKDNIVGILYLKNMLASAKDGKIDTIVKNIMKKPFFVFESKKIDSLLRVFQLRKEHMAIVINSKAQVVGIVTIENILEEIVGEIIDESDRINPSIVQVSKTEWAAKGITEISELNSKTGLAIKESDYDNLDSFIGSTLGRPPKLGEEVSYQNYRFTLEDVQGKKIINARIVKL